MMAVAGASLGDVPVLSEDECERLAQTFERSRGTDGFVDAAESQRLLRRTGLQDGSYAAMFGLHVLCLFMRPYELDWAQEQLLETIWDLSDLDRDGRLSLREFVCAMTLADQARNGQSLPVELHPEQQAGLASRVELLVQARPRKEEFSTVETSASFRAPPAGPNEYQGPCTPISLARHNKIHSFQPPSQNELKSVYGSPICSGTWSFRGLRCTLVWPTGAAGFTDPEPSLPHASPLTATLARGRDSTPRPLTGAEGRERTSDAKAPETLTKLGQLATVLK
eukprot:s10221_g1.t1